ncbi:WD repeat-containing protein 27-like isoform X2 [Halichondria panicea]|uniref:WD repeat-containing protein 27-like isoform X2 n=1 Tax=Halichondria panicea TaxID=6063 RepID=UPI00312B75C4
MDPELVSTLSSCNPGGPLALGLCRRELVVATATNSDIHLHCVLEPNKQNTGESVVLRGHYEAVTLLSFSESPIATSSALLCSVSTDAVLLWNIEECLSEHRGVSSSHQLSCAPLQGGLVHHVTFSEDLQYLAVCKGQEVIICNIQIFELDTTLVGHSAAVTCASFSPHHRHRSIVSVSEDRTFKVWDLQSSCLLYQSAVVSASPFLCLTISSERPVMATGSADGVMRVFDLSEDGGYRCLLKCNVSKETERMKSKKTVSEIDAVVSTTVSSVASWQQPQDHVTEGIPTVDAGPVILTLQYCTPPPSEHFNYEPSLHTASSVDHMREVLQAPPAMLAVTHTHLLLFAATTLELVDSIDLRDPLPSSDVVPSVTAVASLTFDPLSDNRCYCGLVGLFSPSGTVLSLSCSAVRGDHSSDLGADVTDTQVISVLSSVPLAPSSALRAEYSVKEPQKKRTNPSSYGAGTKKTGKPVVDKPLTFKSKVKSSGYTDAPRMKAFTPKVSTTKTTNKKQPTKAPMSQREYPVDRDHPTHLTSTLQCTDRPSAINSCCFSGCGQHLTCACSDNTVYSMRMPLSLKKTHAFVGHDNSVVSVGWSASGEWMISSSKDRTARVWSLSQKDPLLCLDRTTHNNRDTSASKSNPPFSGDISWAQFYYLDRFLLLATSNTLLLYKYHLDTSRSDDIKRYQSGTRYRQVSSLSLESAQSITAMSAINDFHSYIVLVAGSNRAVEVFDMNVGRSIRTHTDAHTRPPHCLQQNKGSRFVSHPPNAYDLYLTAAVTDGIKLWDMRANRCVSRFASHRNHALPVAATFSPCGRFIATGSEDKCAYVYDLRSSSPLHKFKGHSDTVSTVAYHPLTPLLVTGTINGILNIFNSV